MIVVIADDFSGAAELAGAAANLGLSSEVQIAAFDAEPDCDVIAIDTNTRSMAPGDAAEVVRHAVLQALKRSPALLFKKTDSVLRGNVMAELETILDITGQRQALL